MSTISDNRRKFVAALAKLVSPMESKTAAEAMMAMMPSLTDIPERAFDMPGNLAAALAEQFTYCPNLNKLRDALGKWWDANKPAAPALPGEDDATMTREDCLRLQLWHRHRADDFADSGAIGDRRTRMTICLDIQRKTASRVYRYIVRTDTEAASIAVQRHWTDDQPHVGPRERTDEEREQVTRLAQAAITHLAVPRAQRTKPQTAEPHSPEDVLPYLDAIAKRFEAQHGRKMGAVTPEQLREAYAKQPLARDPRDAVNVKSGPAVSPPAPPPVESKPAVSPPLWVPPWERDAA